LRGITVVVGRSPSCKGNLSDFDLSGAPNVEFIDLAERDLADKVGAFRMKTTRMIWRVSADQGQLAVTDHLGVTCRWQGLSPTGFRSPACLSRNDATLVFERRSPERRFENF
jgi:hypothetical protein